MRKIVFSILFLFVMFHSAVFAEDGWTYITEIDGQEIGFVFSIASEEDGSIWVCSQGGVFRYKDNTWTNESTHFDNTAFGYGIRATVSPNGIVWFTSNSSTIVKYDGENWHYYENSETDGVVSWIGVDSQENVWCNAGDGVYKYDGSVWTKHTTQDGPLSNGAGLLKVKPDGEVWVRYGDSYAIDFQHYYGVSRYNGTTWETFNTENGLNSNKVDDIAFGPDGSTYISYGGWSNPRGIMRFNGTSWETLSETVNGILNFGPDGTLWILQNFSDVYTYDGISFKEFPEKPSEQYPFRKIGFDSDGNVWFGFLDGLLKYDNQTGVQQDNNLKPQDYILLNNYPNPFNPSTTLKYSIAQPSHVILEVYSVTGQKVETLVNEFMVSGYHTCVFNGDSLPSGLYFARLKANAVVKTNNMLLIK